jgi:hypothetical protein
LSLAALGLACALPSHAVHINPDGRGQVLIYPYYTVNAGKATLVTLINSRDSAKAVRVRFRESRNGVEVMAFNIYLAPFDVWTGAVFSSSDATDYAQAGPARLASTDNSCTTPRLPSSGQDFYRFDYAGPFSADAGPDQLSRTREGFIEVLELGRIENVEGFAAADAIRRGAPGGPRGCDLLSRAWTSNVSSGLSVGVWSNQPGLGVLSPDGGLEGSAIIVDVALGSSFSVPTVALDGFFVPAADCAPDCRGRGDENLHAGPGEAYPSLADARNGEDGRAVAEFPPGGRAQHMNFTGPDAGLKAVSAVLMRQHLDNTFQQSAAGQSLVARSEWVVTFPTKHLHLAQSTPEQRLPFRSAYGWAAQSPNWPNAGLSGACEPLSVDYGDREGRRVNRNAEGLEFGIPPPPPPAPALCHASQVIRINDSVSPASEGERLYEALRGDSTSALFGSAHALRLRTCTGRKRLRLAPNGRFNNCVSGDFTEGWMRLELGEPQRNYLYSALQPDASQAGSTNLLLGLPAIGFAVSEFEGSDTPGVLANFSTLQEHAGERASRAGQLDAANPAGGWTPVSGD